MSRPCSCCAVLYCIAFEESYLRPIDPLLVQLQLAFRNGSLHVLPQRSLIQRILPKLPHPPTELRHVGLVVAPLDMEEVAPLKVQLEDGGWRMVDGERRMLDGRWWMDDGGGRMVNGGWWLEDGG